MRIEHTDLPGLFAIHPERLSDERGYFVRTFCEDEFVQAGLKGSFKQTSLSYNTKAGTVRGMHYQRSPHQETKLIRCTRGIIFDVVVDLRRDQPTFCKWRGFELSATNGIALYVPEGFAHGFQTLVDDTEVAYAITPGFVANMGTGVHWADPAIDVRWPRAVEVISDRDMAWPHVEMEI